MNAKEILAQLVAIPSVVGTSNGAIVDFIRGWLGERNVPSTIIAGPEGDRFNLFATIGDASVAGGYVLSGHMDVVPAQDATWTSNPFILKQEGERLIGRGAVDMKGFVSCVLAAVPAFLEKRLDKPLHLAFSYDEEAGCRGMPHLIERMPSLCAPPAGCIVGEPTDMRTVLRHKGKMAARLSMAGRSGHSSRPELGLNAIHGMADVIACIRDEATRHTKEGPFNPMFEPPCSTLQVGVITGGSAVNVIPAHCALDMEIRAIPGVDPMSLFLPVESAARRLATEEGYQVETAILSSYPGLDLRDDDPLVALAESVSGKPNAGAVSFGTEAGLYQQAGIPAVVCGPGDIARAHRPNEFILESELAECQAALERLAERLC
jgi:acetylornithine deacetylase